MELAETEPLHLSPILGLEDLVLPPPLPEFLLPPPLQPGAALLLNSACVLEEAPASEGASEDPPAERDAILQLLRPGPRDPLWGIPEAGPGPEEEAEEMEVAPPAPEPPAEETQPPEEAPDPPEEETTAPAAAPAAEPPEEEMQPPEEAPEPLPLEKAPEPLPPEPLPPPEPAAGPAAPPQTEQPGSRPLLEPEPAAAPRCSPPPSPCPNPPTDCATWATEVALQVMTEIVDRLEETLPTLVGGPPTAGAASFCPAPGLAPEQPSVENTHRSGGATTGRDESIARGAPPLQVRAGPRRRGGGAPAGM